MAFIITALVYICLGASLSTHPGAGISRYIEDMLVTFCCCFFLWSGCCLFGTFPISILNFICNKNNPKEKHYGLTWNLKKTDRKKSNLQWLSPLMVSSQVFKINSLLYLDDLYKTYKTSVQYNYLIGYILT